MGGFTYLQGLPLKNSICSEILCVKQETYMSSVEYFYYKKESHDTTKPLWLFDKLGLN